MAPPSAVSAATVASLLDFGFTVFGALLILVCLVPYDLDPYAVGQFGVPRKEILLRVICFYMIWSPIDGLLLKSLFAGPETFFDKSRAHFR